MTTLAKVCRCLQVNNESLAAVADRFRGSLSHIPRDVTRSVYYAAFY